jgi:hypothetical protein
MDGAARLRDLLAQAPLHADRVEEAVAASRVLLEQIRAIGSVTAAADLVALLDAQSEVAVGAAMRAGRAAAESVEMLDAVADHELAPLVARYGRERGDAGPWSAEAVRAAVHEDAATTSSRARSGVDEQRRIVEEGRAHAVRGSRP